MSILKSLIDNPLTRTVKEKASNLWGKVNDTINETRLSIDHALGNFVKKNLKPRENVDPRGIPFLKFFRSLITSTFYRKKAKDDDSPDSDIRKWAGAQVHNADKAIEKLTSDTRHPDVKHQESLGRRFNSVYSIREQELPPQREEQERSEKNFRVGFLKALQSELGRKNMRLAEASDPSSLLAKQVAADNVRKTSINKTIEDRPDLLFHPPPQLEKDGDPYSDKHRKACSEARKKQDQTQCALVSDLETYGSEMFPYREKRDPAACARAFVNKHRDVLDSSRFNTVALGQISEDGKIGTSLILFRGKKDNQDIPASKEEVYDPGLERLIKELPPRFKTQEKNIRKLWEKYPCYESLSQYIYLYSRVMELSSKSDEFNFDISINPEQATPLDYPHSEPDIKKKILKVQINFSSSGLSADNLYFIEGTPFLTFHVNETATDDKGKRRYLTVDEYIENLKPKLQKKATGIGKLHRQEEKDDDEDDYYYDNEGNRKKKKKKGKKKKD
jgi:hypothetical protein